ncbi:hypothetical protein, partial [Deinococcus pimensis]|uniref:hypothetical protein n=1 Tax=Deinococcus pimensis TaxID=309888 RepID=UPI0005EADE41
WAAGLSAEAGRFPGHLGVGVIRPARVGPREYTLVVRFSDFGSFRAWQDSPQRAAWLARASELIEGEPRESVTGGLEYWFTPPDSPVLRQPPRWKMVLLTVLALYPLNLSLNLLFAPHLTAWPLAARLLLFAVLVVSMMTYLVMPWVTRLFAPWLSPTEPNDETRERSRAKP